MSRQFSKEEIADFYNTLDSIAQCDDSDLALPTLAACCPDSNTTKELLIQYHDDYAVFKPLIDADRSELLNYLYELNTNILVLPIARINEAKFPARADRERAKFQTLANIALCQQYPNILAWLEEKKPEPFIFHELELQQIAKEALEYIPNEESKDEEKLNNFEILFYGMDLPQMELFCQSKYSQEVFQAAVNRADRWEDRSYVQALVTTDISALRVIVYGQSLLSTLCDDANGYYAILASILEDDETLAQLNKEEKTELEEATDISLELAQHNHLFTANDSSQTMPEQTSGIQLPTEKAPQTKHIDPTSESKNLPYIPLLNASEFSQTMFKRPNGIQLNFEERALLKTYIDPNLWPDNLALDAFLHNFFEKLAERGFILRPTISSHVPIEPENLIKLVSEKENEYITSIAVDNGQIIPAFTSKKTTHPIAYALIPIQHDNHYGLLILDLLSTSLEGKYIAGKNNYFIEPYAAHIPLAPIHVRLANILRLITPENGHFPISVINCSQTNIGSPCSDYIIGAILRIVLDNSNAISNFKNHQYFLPEEMILKIRMMMCVELGFDYFKLQLSTHVKNQPEEVLEQAFKTIKGIKDRFTRPQPNPSKEVTPSQSPKSHSSINLANYKKWALSGQLELLSESAERRGIAGCSNIQRQKTQKQEVTSAPKRPRTDFFRVPPARSPKSTPSPLPESTPKKPSGKPMSFLHLYNTISPAQEMEACVIPTKQQEQKEKRPNGQYEFQQELELPDGTLISFKQTL